MLIFKSGTQHLEDYISVKYLSISKICDFLKSVFCGHYKNNYYSATCSCFWWESWEAFYLIDRCKKRLRKPTFIGLKPVTRVNTIWGKASALYLKGYVLVLFNHIYNTISYKVIVENWYYLMSYYSVSKAIWEL